MLLPSILLQSVTFTFCEDKAAEDALHTRLAVVPVSYEGCGDVLFGALVLRQAYCRLGPY